jgi:hypothetical protein
VHLNNGLLAEVPQFIVYDAAFGDPFGLPDPLQDNYSLCMMSGVFLSTPPRPYADVTIQTPVSLPTNANSLRLLAWQDHADLVVKLGTQQIPMVELARNGGVISYGGDISALAGVTEDLSITATTRIILYTPPPNFSLVANSRLILDGLSLSALPIPEPTAVVLACGALVWPAIRRRRKFGQHFVRYPSKVFEV